MLHQPPEGHPALEILGEVNSYLDGKSIVLGVTASVAIYKSIDLARWIVRRKGHVTTVMTREAERLISREMFRWASGGEVYIEFTGDTEHIILSKTHSAMIVAPATLSTMAKIAYGIVDNPVALTAVTMLGEGKPVVLVPAMHGSMYSSPQSREIVDRLESQGYKVVTPLLEGSVAKYPDLHTVGRTVASLARTGSQDLKNVKVLVTLGSTREWIDRVRYISNPSSGSMGVEIGLELYARGASVDVVAGHTTVDIPHVFNTVKCDTTEDMAEKVRKLTEIQEYDVIVASGAPVDFKPKSFRDEKLRSGSALTLELAPTPKVLENLSKRPKMLVAFAAEYVESLEKLKQPALEKLAKYHSDLIVANRVGLPGAGFASPYLEALILDSHGRELFKGRTHKENIAAIIVDFISSGLGKK